jgi:hypothetical protein
MHFEHRREPLLPSPAYAQRVVRHAMFAAAIVFGSLCLGIVGYHFTEKLPWLDALLEAAMILSGEGPVYPLQTTAGKLFASFYALFSGVAFVTIVGVLFVPVFHRFLHKFHVELGAQKSPGQK